MKFWLGFFILFSCGCIAYSQDLSISKIEQIGDVTIIDNSKAELTDNSKEYLACSKSDLKDKKSRKYGKRKVQNDRKLDLGYSRKVNPEKNKSPELAYKNSSSDTFFLTSSGEKFSAVLSSYTSVEVKKSVDYQVIHITFSKDLLAKKNTYYYLFSRDTGEQYQFFNKPPPSFIILCSGTFFKQI